MMEISRQTRSEGTDRQTSSERYLFRKIYELEKHQREQDELIEYLEGVIRTLTDKSI